MFCKRAVFVMFLTAAMLTPAALVRADAVAPELKGITIDEKKGSIIPLDLPFVDETGKPVKLGDYFHHGRPVILQLSYFGCPMLCPLIAAGMVDSLNHLSLVMGKDFDVIDISFNPREGPKLAAKTKAHFLEAYNRPAGAEHWHFLTGKPDAIKKITDAVGFRYKYLPKKKQYSHPAALIILTPKGKVSRYLYGVKFNPRTLRLSLVEASNGKIGSTIDRLILTCCSFDSYTGRYTATALGVMKIGGVLTMLALGIAVLGFALHHHHHRRHHQDQPGAQASDLPD